MSFKLFYGVEGYWTDLTLNAISTCLQNEEIILPGPDPERAAILTDPLHGVRKFVKIVTNDGVVVFDDTKPIRFKLSADQVASTKAEVANASEQELRYSNAIVQLRDLQSQLKLKHGNFREEFPEQLMSIQFIKPNAVVLEIGGNVGRNSCIIAKILEPNSRNLLVLESDPSNAELLRENREVNGLSFHIEAFALSRARLQQKNWDTKPIDSSVGLLQGWKEVNTITWSQLKQKYQLSFDTLVADCEGALYYILLEEPSLLNGMHTLIMENDYIHHPEHKLAVFKILSQHSFVPVYTKAHAHIPDFYQVWQRDPLASVHYVDVDHSNSIDVTDLAKQSFVQGTTLVIPKGFDYYTNLNGSKLPNSQYYGRKLVVNLRSGQHVDIHEWARFRIRKVDLLTGDRDFRWTEQAEFDLNCTVSKPLPPIFVYFHVSALGNWMDVVRAQLTRFSKDSFYDLISQIRIGFLGDTLAISKLRELIKPFTKAVIHVTGENIKMAERLTLTALREDSQSSEFFALYLHSKGVTRFNDKIYPNIVDWVEAMCFFLVSQHQSCLRYLNSDAGVSALGLNCYTEPFPHFSGNFWWAKSSYVRTLSTEFPPEYVAPEFWILSGNCSALNLAHIPQATYRVRCPPELYVDKTFKCRLFRKINL